MILHSPVRIHPFRLTWYHIPAPAPKVAATKWKEKNMTFACLWLQRQALVMQQPGCFATHERLVLR